MGQCECIYEPPFFDIPVFYLVISWRLLIRLCFMGQKEREIHLLSFIFLHLADPLSFPHVTGSIFGCNGRCLFIWCSSVSSIVL